MYKIASNLSSFARLFPPLATSKRLVDIVLGVGLILLFSPIIVVTAVILGLQGRPVLFGHRRVGLHGREFTVWKFCTMERKADRQLQRILGSCPDSREAWAHSRKLPNDPRVTPLGRVLRRSSVDELPQLWNVLRGEMSLVGPRPVPRDELEEKYGLATSAYQSVQPGLTGLWQVSGRNTLKYPERVALDQLYAASRDAKMDAFILWRTVWTLMRFDGW